MFAIKNLGVLARLSLSCALAVAMLLVALPATCSAQRYSKISPKMDLRASKKLKSKVSTAMRNNAAFGADGKESIDRYYKTYYFPMMTQTSPQDLTRLGKSREDLIKQIRSTSVPAAQQHLTELTLKYMRGMSRGNFHPAVRYNAALLLGMLDQKYAVSGANPTPPVALSAGSNELLELLEKKEFKGVKVHPSVKVGALEGLERHVQFGLDAKYKDRVTQAALAVVAQKPTALDIRADVNDWMKCQAARVLVQQFQAGPNPEVQTALTELIADEDMSLDDRCYVVDLLGAVEFAGTDTTALLLPAGNLLLAVVTEGAEKAKEFEDLIVGSPGARRSSYGGRSGEQETKLERRELLSRLKSIVKGANSFSEGLPEEGKQKVHSMIALLGPAIQSASKLKELDLEVTDEILKLENKVSSLVLEWQPAEPAAAAAVEFTE